MTDKRFLDLAYRRTAGAGVAVNFTRALGASFRLMRGSDDRRYLVVLIWWPKRGGRLLSYRTGSVRC